MKKNYVYDAWVDNHNLQDLGSNVGPKWVQAGQVNDRQNIWQSWPNKIQEKN